jgi:hypothetical protein
MCAHECLGYCAHVCTHVYVCACACLCGTLCEYAGCGSGSVARQQSKHVTAVHFTLRMCAFALRVRVLLRCHHAFIVSMFGSPWYMDLGKVIVNGGVRMKVTLSDSWIFVISRTLPQCFLAIQSMPRVVGWLSPWTPSVCCSSQCACGSESEGYMESEKGCAWCIAHAHGYLAQMCACCCLACAFMAPMFLLAAVKGSCTRTLVKNVWSAECTAESPRQIVQHAIPPTF